MHPIKSAAGRELIELAPGRKGAETALKRAFESLDFEQFWTLDRAAMTKTSPQPPPQRDGMKRQAVFEVEEDVLYPF
jgi:hypothetical protein